MKPLNTLKWTKNFNAGTAKWTNISDAKLKVLLKKIRKNLSETHCTDVTLAIKDTLEITKNFYTFSTLKFWETTKTYSWYIKKQQH